MSIMQQLSTVKFDRLSITSFMWAVTVLVHPWPFYRRIILGEEGLTIILLIIAALAVLIRPKSVFLFLLMLVLSIMYTVQKMPFISNHIMFEMLVQVFIVTGIILSLYKIYRHNGTLRVLNEHALRDHIFDSFAPVVRVCVVILYFFAVFHKLNWGFLDPAYSHSVHLIRDVQNIIPVLPHNELVKYLSIWGTLIIEAAIAILFCFRSTRLAGVFVAMVFHIIISFNPLHTGFTSFSAMLYTLFFYFTPKSLPDALTSMANNLVAQLRGKGSYLLKSILLAFVLLIAGLLWAGYKLYLSHGQDGVYYVVYSLIIIWWLILFIPLIYAVRFYNIKSESGMLYLRPGHQVLFPVLLLLNGFSPYLGLKTHHNFNMFTNLRTEGGYTNHIFMPSWLQVFDFQKDLVQITSTNVDALKDYLSEQEKKMMVDFEFVRTIKGVNTDAYVDYIRNGVPHRLEIKAGTIKATEELKTYPELLYKIMWFKQVYNSEHSLDINH